MSSQDGGRRLSKSRSTTSVVAGSVSQLRRLWDRKMGGGGGSRGVGEEPLQPAAKGGKLQQLRGIKVKNEKQKESNALQMSRNSKHSESNALRMSNEHHQGIIGKKLSTACVPLQRNIGHMCERGSTSDSDSTASLSHQMQAPNFAQQLRKDASGATHRGVTDAGVVRENKADRSGEVNVKVTTNCSSNQQFFNGDTGTGKVNRKVEVAQCLSGSRSTLYNSVTSQPHSAPPCVSGGSGTGQKQAFSDWYADAESSVTSLEQRAETSSPLIGQSMTLTRHHSKQKKQQQHLQLQQAQSNLHSKFDSNFRPPLARSASEGHAPADVRSGADPVSLEDFRDMSLDSLVQFLRDKSAQLSRAPTTIAPSRRHCERDARMTSISEGPITQQHLSRSNFELRSAPHVMTSSRSAVAGAFADSSSPSSSLSDSSDATPTEEKPNPFVAMTSQAEQPYGVRNAPFVSKTGAPIYSHSNSGGSGMVTSSICYDVDEAQAAELDRDYVERKYEEMKYWTLQRRRKPPIKLGTSGSSSTIAETMTSQALVTSARLGQSEVRIIL